ncbi:MAG: exodeoxyribonuclease VII small subunit [Prevotella sp.]|nr:exodeoxyribonuclease VII small subunit [Prevotella sp.]
MTMKKELNYEEAIAEVDKIVKKLSSEEIDVDTLATDVKRATQLLEILEAKLHKTQDEMKTLLKSLK